MPNLLTERTQKKRKVPPCGRIIEFLPPHSPFQLLIDGARLAKGYSERELARIVAADGVHMPVSTLYLWLHSKSGIPSKKSCGPQHVRAFAKHLSIKESDIRSAIEASGYRYTPSREPTPKPHMDAFAMFIQTLQNDKRTNITRKYALNLAKRLYASALAATETPVPPL